MTRSDIQALEAEYEREHTEVDDHVVTADTGNCGIPTDQPICD